MSIRAMATVQVLLALIMLVFVIMKGNEIKEGIYRVYTEKEEGKKGEDISAFGKENAKGEKRSGSKEKKDKERMLVTLISIQYAKQYKGNADERKVEEAFKAEKERERRTIEKQKEEEVVRLDEVRYWYEGFMLGQEGNSEIVGDIFEQYLENRYKTFGKMEVIDKVYARKKREEAKLLLGGRLMKELPPAQGALVLQQLFI